MQLTLCTSRIVFALRSTRYLFKDLFSLEMRNSGGFSTRTDYSYIESDRIFWRTWRHESRHPKKRFDIQSCRFSSLSAQPFPHPFFVDFFKGGNNMTGLLMDWIWIWAPKCSGRGIAYNWRGDKIEKCYDRLTAFIPSCFLEKLRIGELSEKEEGGWCQVPGRGEYNFIKIIYSWNRYNTGIESLDLMKFMLEVFVFIK